MAERRVQVVLAKGMGPPGAPPVVCRQFGTVDIEGNGTEINYPDGTPLQNAGPFVLLDLVGMASSKHRRNLPMLMRHARILTHCV